MEKRIQTLWNQLRQRLEIPVHLAKPVFQQLKKHYKESHRHYHTLPHIAAILGWIDQYERLLTDPDAVRLAAWFHDVIYDPLAKDNEAQSAVWGTEVLKNWEIDPDRIANVEAMIMSTAGHQPRNDTVDCRFLLDADLAILGSAPDAYLRYTKAIRKEYSVYPDPAYRMGRLAVLQEFMKREIFYFTPEMKNLLEEQARRNLADEIAVLKG